MAGLLLNPNQDPIPVPVVNSTTNGVVTPDMASQFPATGNIAIYVDPVSGDDAAAGTITAPVKTMAQANALNVSSWRGLANTNFAAGSLALPASTQFPQGNNGSAAASRLFTGTNADQFGAITSDLQRAPLLAVAMTAVDTVATVDSTAGLPSTGTVTIGFEQCAYTGKTATSFTGLTRGANATTHAIGSPVLVSSSSRACTAGTNANNIIDSTLASFRSGAAASITAISGSGQTKTMTVTGMSGLTAADVGKNFLFALASNISSSNGGTNAVTVVLATSPNKWTLSGLTGGSFTAASVGNYVKLTGMTNAGNNGVFRITAFISATSVTVFNPAGVAEVSAGTATWREQALATAGTGNNGTFKMASFISPTSATFYNAQALVENTGAIYWQDSYRGASITFLTGAASLTGVKNSTYVTDHGGIATASVTVAGVVTAGDTLVLNDGTNPNVTLTWSAAPAVATDVLIGADNNANAANLAAVINALLPNSGASPLRIKATNTAGTAVVKLRNMLGGSVGNTATPTKTGVWTPTIVTFATNATGIGSPTTTFSVGFAFPSVPAVGNTFQVTKPATVLTYTGTAAFAGTGTALGFIAIKIQGAAGANLTTQYLSWQANQFEMDLNTGSFTMTNYSLVGSNTTTSTFVNNPNQPFTPNTFGNPTIAYIHHGSWSCQFATNTVVSVIADNLVHNLTAITFAGGAIFGKRCTVNATQDSVVGTPYNIDSGLNMSDTVFTLNGGRYTPATPSGPVVENISNSGAYGMVITNGAAAVLNAVQGDGNAIAGIQVSGSSVCNIDQGGTSSMSGILGDFEFAAETIPNFVSYATIRTANPALGVFRTVKNVVGSNGAGACTATGLRVGDKTFMVSFAKVPTAAAGTQAGLTAFEATITVANQIQQTGAANLSAEAFDVIVQAVGTQKGYADGYENRANA